MKTKAYRVTIIIIVCITISVPVHAMLGQGSAFYKPISPYITAKRQKALKESNNLLSYEKPKEPYPEIDDNQSKWDNWDEDATIKPENQELKLASNSKAPNRLGRWSNWDGVKEDRSFGSDETHQLSLGSRSSTSAKSDIDGECDEILRLASLSTLASKRVKKEIGRKTPEPSTFLPVPQLDLAALLLVMPTSARAQITRSITTTVKSSNNNPIAGLTINTKNLDGIGPNTESTPSSSSTQNQISSVRNTKLPKISSSSQSFKPANQNSKWDEWDKQDPGHSSLNHKGSYSESCRQASFNNHDSFNSTSSSRQELPYYNPLTITNSNPLGKLLTPRPDNLTDSPCSKGNTVQFGKLPQYCSLNKFRSPLIKDLPSTPLSPSSTLLSSASMSSLSLSTPTVFPKLPGFE